ncbi:MAG: hypothetical protein LBH48_05400 [Bifidobacteriaceae bacterium]|jgi:S-DNA-T family DNA segregation ATPase FtsK/SpoIIIE|nr:hypothetical protein [Bifidobacteriaceae bacterium]
MRHLPAAGDPWPVRFTLACPNHGDHDVWAAPGTDWGDVIVELDGGPVQLLECLKTCREWFVGAEPVGPADKLGSGALLPGAVVATRRAPATASDRSPWEWVVMTSEAAGRSVPCSADVTSPLGPPLAIRFSSSMQVLIMPRSGTVSWYSNPLAARPKRSRLSHPSTRLRWRPVRKRWTRLKPFALVAAGDDVWQLRRRPGGEPTWTQGTGDDRPATAGVPGSEVKPAWVPVVEKDPGQRKPVTARLREVMVPLIGAIAIGVVMVTVSRNPMFALLPLLGVVGFLGPQLAGGRRRIGIIDFDGAGLVRAGPEGSGGQDKQGRARGVAEPQEEATTLRLAPFEVEVPKGALIHVGPDNAAAIALVRTWLLAEAHRRRPGGLAVQTGRAPWGWTRWLAPSRPELTVALEGTMPAAGQVGITMGANAPAGAVRVEAHQASLGLLAVRVDGGAHAIVQPIGSASAERLARQLAGRGGQVGEIRDIVSALPLELTAWRWANPTMSVPIGIGEDGAPVHLDLPADGPHLLVAGATGSGKSEFLRGLMLATALSVSPDELVIIGIDHKGGATFADLQALPHLAGMVTDLDTGETDRAVVALAAELTRRERLLAERGLEAIIDLPPEQRPPRILVVVDEFRNLVESLPDAMSRLERLAAQGRSLGMHLVLATQRPAGAVSSHLRANLAFRVCFRVATDTDSIDLIDTSDAARIQPDLPGTCFVASAGRPLMAMRALLATSPCSPPPAAQRWPDRWTSPPPGPMASREEVTAQLAELASGLGYARSKPPWLAPLPPMLLLDAIPSDGPGEVGGLCVGLTDLPERQLQVPLKINPGDGNVLVIGAPRSGRTTAAHTMAVAALTAGHDVHVVCNNPAAFTDLTSHPRFGTLVGLDDPRRVGRLLRLLRDAPRQSDSRPAVLVVDGAEALAPLNLVGFDDHPLEILAGGGGMGLWLFATCLARHAGGRWAGHFPTRLVLPTIDKVEDITAGASNALAGRNRPAGRAISIHRGQEAITQIAVAGAPPAVEAVPGELPPLRLEPLPAQAGPLPEARPGWAWLGYGGDDAGPIGVDLAAGHPLGVVGPPGSGRSTVLRSIAAQCAELAVDVITIDAAEHPNPWQAIERALDCGNIVLADNLERASGAPPGLPATGTLVAAMATATAASFHGPGPLLRNRPCGIVLMPGMPGSAEAFGVRLAEAIDTRLARTPGFGVVVTPRGVSPVQTPFFGPDDSLLQPAGAGLGTQGSQFGSI